jgi:hypothetical protein
MMETAMSNEIRFAPRTIAQARSERTRHLGLRLRGTARAMIGWLRAARERIAMNSRYQHELVTLLHADDRMLADIGITRHDVASALHESRRFFGRRAIMEGAAARQEAAFHAAQTRRDALPETDAPPLVPAAPRAFETSNVR